MAGKDFPPVVLDTTLYDLISDDLGDKDVTEWFCTVKPTSDLNDQGGHAAVSNSKYMIQSAQSDDGDVLAHLETEICSYLLAFFAGPMKVVFLASEGWTEDPTLSRQIVDQNARRSFGVINEKQRPKVVTFKNVEDFTKNHGNGAEPVRFNFAMDFADHIPGIFSPELVYELNSKRLLGVSEFQNPNTTIIDAEVSCSRHTSQKWHFQKDCQECDQGIDTEIQRVVKILKERRIPFVLKLTQSLSSIGTHIIDDEKKRKELIDFIKDYLKTYLSRITQSNAALDPTALVISDALPGGTAALNFYSRRDGKGVFLGACTQLATGKDAQQATAIEFEKQAEGKKKYQSVIDRVCAFLAEKGYYGAVGADIMEDEEGKQHVIDLNVRTPLSLLLYLLKGHFYEKRGYKEALIYECQTLKISRDEFEDKFAQELNEARLIIIGCTRLGESKRWCYGLILAGQDRKEIDALSDRLNKFSE